MKRDNFYELMENVVQGINEQVKETVEESYNLGFKNGCKSFKRYAVNVIWFDADFAYKDVFKRFATLEDAKIYAERVSGNKDCAAYIYEYNYINDQYERMDDEQMGA